MKKKITALCSIIIALSICITVFGTIDTVNGDVTTATMKSYYAPKAETTNNSLDESEGDMLGDLLGGMDSAGLGDALGGFGGFSDALGGMGDVLGGIADGMGNALGGIADGMGDALGGIFGGGPGSESTTVNTTVPAPTTSANIDLIIPVPAATQATSETETLTETLVAGETVDYAATSNPYTKPSAAFSAGDEDETIKWLQWIFIYTGYGLKDDGITGILDEDTVAIVKKLQYENQLTVDGNITEDVIKAAEVLYYQSIIGADVSAIEVSSDATTGESVSNQAVDTGDENSIPVIILIIVLVITWVLVIGGIVILFIFKKKKMNAAKNASAEKADNKGIADAKNEKSEKTEIRSLSDLFEEAENKNK